MSEPKYLLDPVELERALNEYDPLARVLAKPENEELRKEWEKLEQEEREILVALQHCFCETDYSRALGAASHVQRKIVDVASRRWAARRICERLLAMDVPSFKVKVGP